MEYFTLFYAIFHTLLQKISKYLWNISNFVAKIKKLYILTNICSHPKLNCSGLVPGTLDCLQSYKNKKNGKVKILLDTSKREKKLYKLGWRKYVRYFQKTKLFLILVIIIQQLN